MDLRYRPLIRAAGSTFARDCRGFTVLELLVVILIMGLLLALLLPAVVYAREAARRVTCVSQLRQLGIALQAEHDTYGRLPTAWRPAMDGSDFAYGWAICVLDELDHAPISHQLDLRRRPTSPMIDLINAVDFASLKCPSDISDPTFELLPERDDENSFAGTSSPSKVKWDSTTLPTANYVGVFGTSEADDYREFGDTLPQDSADGAVVHDRRVRLSDLHRGLSKTLLVGERTMATVPSTWFGVDLYGEDAPCRLVGSAITRPNCESCDECEFSSRHSGGSSFLWADGHVDFITDSVETKIYRTFAMRVAYE
jgi:prepilin-type N-terminal cleavage/methylation domain-containing protein/prepilin-type processing-associated H-X9-DG protein